MFERFPVSFLMIFPFLVDSEASAELSCQQLLLSNLSPLKQLTNEPAIRKRARYDSGEDLIDPTDMFGGGGGFGGGRGGSFAMDPSMLFNMMNGGGGPQGGPGGGFSFAGGPSYGGAGGPFGGAQFGGSPGGGRGRGRGQQFPGFHFG
jgi:hypothetical protein